MDFEAQGVCIFVFLSTLLNGALMQWTVPSRPMWLREKLDVSVGDPAGGHWGKKKINVCGLFGLITLSIWGSGRLPATLLAR